MKSDVTEMIADLVFQSAPDLTSRLESQAEALRETECNNPALGRWVDAFDAQHLFSALALDDGDFAERYPAAAHVGWAQRQQLVSMLEAHFEQCRHCSLKRGYDLELDSRIEQACRRNNDFLLQLLAEEETEAATEEEPLQAQPKTFQAQQI